MFNTGLVNVREFLFLPAAKRAIFCKFPRNVNLKKRVSSRWSALLLLKFIKKNQLLAHLEFWQGAFS